MNDSYQKLFEILYKAVIGKEDGTIVWYHDPYRKDGEACEIYASNSTLDNCRSLHVSGKTADGKHIDKHFLRVDMNNVEGVAAYTILMFGEKVIK